ncbi:unnamed protein product [marine sediment metagenome]|uniref:Uncharacterized protein n=1 Tax=marine sediment metagenome TaxID=412755 RepID=X1AA85_9ZZZZ
MGFVPPKGIPPGKGMPMAEFILNLGFSTLDFFSLYGITHMIREIFELSPDGYRGDLMNEVNLAQRSHDPPAGGE